MTAVVFSVFNFASKLNNSIFTVVGKITNKLDVLNLRYKISVKKQIILTLKFNLNNNLKEKN